MIKAKYHVEVTATCCGCGSIANRVVYDEITAAGSTARMLDELKRKAVKELKTWAIEEDNLYCSVACYQKHIIEQWVKEFKERHPDLPLTPKSDTE